MTLATADFKIAGAIAGTGRVLIVDHTTDNPLVTFRFQHADVKMSAAEKEFEVGGHHFAPGAFVIADGEPRRARARPSRSSACRRGRSTRRRTCRCTISTCRASATCTPGRARRTKAGCAWRSTTSRCRTPISPRRSCAKATCARSTTSSSFRMRGREAPR